MMIGVFIQSFTLLFSTHTHTHTHTHTYIYIYIYIYISKEIERKREMKGHNVWEKEKGKYTETVAGLSTEIEPTKFLK